MTVCINKSRCQYLAGSVDQLFAFNGLQLPDGNDATCFNTNRSCIAFCAGSIDYLGIAAQPGGWWRSCFSCWLLLILWATAG